MAWRLMPPVWKSGRKLRLVSVETRSTACEMFTALAQVMENVWITHFGLPVVPDVPSRYQMSPERRRPSPAGPAASSSISARKEWPSPPASSVTSGMPLPQASSRAVAEKASSWIRSFS